MTLRRIAIADCLQGDLADYCYNRVSSYVRPDFEPFRLRAMNDPIPDDPESWSIENNVAALVVAGSLHSPLDPEPWILELGNFTAGFFSVGRPMLAICFGHELIAQALGGKLEKKSSLTVEFKDIRILKDDPLFQGLEKTSRMPVAHEVMVASVPPDFDVIGSTDDCPVQAMRHSTKPVYGVQFHPEMDAGIRGFDPNWRVLSEASLEKSEGPVVMKNFIGIVRQLAEQ